MFFLYLMIHFKCIQKKPFFSSIIINSNERRKKKSKNKFHYGNCVINFEKSDRNFNISWVMPMHFPPICKCTKTMARYVRTYAIYKYSNRNEQQRKDGKHVIIFKIEFCVRRRCQATLQLILFNILLVL